MTTDTGPLKSLLVDQDAIDTSLVAEALSGRVGIDSKSGALVLGQLFHPMKNEMKVLSLLLARLAAFMLEVMPDERLAVKELVESSGLPRGSVAPALRRLYTESKLIGQAADKRYFIPRSKVIPVVEAIRQDGA